MNDNNDGRDEEMFDDEAGQREEFGSVIVNEIEDIKNLIVDALQEDTAGGDFTNEITSQDLVADVDVDDYDGLSTSSGDGCDPITMVTVKDDEVQSDASDADSESGLSSDSEKGIEEKEFLHMSMAGYQDRVRSVMESATSSNININPHTVKYMSMASELFIEKLSSVCGCRVFFYSFPCK